MAQVITNKGLEVIATRLKGDGGDPIYLAWGTGAGTPAVTDTTLFTEASEARVEGVAEIITVGTENDTYRVTGAMTADGAKTITNWGLFDAPTGGNLIAKGNSGSGQAVITGQMIAFVYRLQISRCIAETGGGGSPD